MNVVLHTTRDPQGGRRRAARNQTTRSRSRRRADQDARRGARRLRRAAAVYDGIAHRVCARRNRTFGASASTVWSRIWSASARVSSVFVHRTRRDAVARREDGRARGCCDGRGRRVGVGPVGALAPSRNFMGALLLNVKPTDPVTLRRSHGVARRGRWRSSRHPSGSIAGRARRPRAGDAR